MKLKMNQGVDILANVGSITTFDEARELIESKCDEENITKFRTIENDYVIMKIANAASMMAPDAIWINSGSKEDLKWAMEKAIETGEEFRLALPNHTCHYDLPEDQARLVNQTYYIVNEDEDISVLAKKEIRSEALAYIKEHLTGIMKGKIMLVSFWNRGPVGAKAAIPAIMITDSFYVVHSGNILYYNAFPFFDKEIARAGFFYTNCHSYGHFKSEDVPKARVYMDRSWQTTYSFYCTYAGNTLMLKKGNHRFTVDRCTYYRVGKEISEHMYITGITDTEGRKTFIAGAAPSGCGKTTTAMVGTDFIGDDLAQFWIDNDGTIRGINPEKGIFGIVRDVNREGDPYLMKALRGDIPAEVIFSNVLVTKDGTPRWENDGDVEPTMGKHFTGEWKTGKTDSNGNLIPFSHKNARCTINCTDIENYNKELATSHAGVPIKIFTYSGRDSDTNPPVWVAKNPDQGVVIGASIVSAATATEVGATGVNRQPWANAPFVAGPLANYMEAQLKFFNSKKIKNKPIIAGLNYFLTEGARGEDPNDTNLIGEKRDVKAWLTWLDRRAHTEVNAINSPIGYLPLFDDLKSIFKVTINKNYTEELYTKQFSLYVDNILARIDLQTEAYGKEKNCPQIIFKVYQKQRTGLEKLKDKFGSIIKPNQLIEECGTY